MRFGYIPCFNVNHPNEYTKGWRNAAAVSILCDSRDFSERERRDAKGGIDRESELVAKAGWPRGGKL